MGKVGTAIVVGLGIFVIVLVGVISASIFSLPGSPFNSSVPWIYAATFLGVLVLLYVLYKAIFE